MRERLMKLDWEKWGTNTLTFLAPLLIIYLVFLQANITGDGFQFKDFRPTDEVFGAMSLYLVNILLDFLKKFRAVETL